MKLTSLKFVLALLLTTVAGATHAQDSAVSFDVFTRKADALAKQGRHAQAIVFYEAAREEAEKLGPGDPRVSSIWKKLAASYEATKNVRRANECLKKALGAMDCSSSPTKTATPAGKPGAPAKVGTPARPAKVASPGTANGTKEDDKLGPYIAAMQAKVRSLWNPPDGVVDRKVITVFSIDSAGAVSNIKIKQSSGSQVVDESAIKAVNDAAPFEAMPPGATTRLDVQFELDYNVHDAKPPAATPPKK
ncbi:MAG: TonB family protein [Candidatus Obscuribacterales bacterium]|nr:TonB family protein [Candidatus Obscuribacterales bacterium]